MIKIIRKKRITCKHNLLFFRIDEILWHGEKILVMNKVIIEPPYRPENVRIKQGVKEDESTLKNLNHIRKIVSASGSESEVFFF